MSLCLTALGGAAAWPNPGQGCTSWIVEESGASLVVDCGPDTLHELRRHVDYSAVDAIVISHCHADHILDLVPYRYGLKYGPARPARRIPLWLPPAGIHQLQKLADAFGGQGEDASSFWDEGFSLREFAPVERLTIGPFDVTFAPTRHFIPCFGIRVNGGEGRSIAFSSDTGAIEPLLELMTGANVVVVEATLPSDDQTPASERGHLTPRDAGRLAAEARAETLVLTHLWSERPDHEVVEHAARVFRGRIIVAKPGLRVVA